MIRVYTASKLDKAPLWKELHDKWPHVYFHARWLKHVQIQTPDNPEHARSFWLQDEIDVKHADALLIFAEDGEHLRGALVEAGIAIASNVRVVVVGKHSDYGTWQYHPGVTRVDDLEAAYQFFIDIDKENGTHTA